MHYLASFADEQIDVLILDRATDVFDLYAHAARSTWVVRQDWNVHAFDELTVFS